jgi:hypothetical protein
MLSNCRKASSDNSDEADEKAMIASANLLLIPFMAPKNLPSDLGTLWKPEPRRPQRLAAWWPTPPFAVAPVASGWTSVLPPLNEIRAPGC